MEQLKNYILNLKSVAVAFSGGVDSSFLLKLCHNLLGEKCIAVTVASCFVPEREKNAAKDFCEKNGIRQIVIEMNPLEIDGVKENPRNRCYLCKSAIFKKIKEIAEEKQCTVVDGTNLSDTKDFRPGLQALEELGIKSPLKECGFTKEDVRRESKNLGLENWNAPSFACLASRFVYGEEITKEKLSRVERAEDFLSSKGFRQFRVRDHNNLARIEVLPEEMEKLFLLRQEVSLELKRTGFSFVTFDMAGFKSGSMN